MDISVHSWQICVKKMCISKGISYIRQVQRSYTKVLHEIYPNMTKVFPCLFVFSNNFRFTSYKYVTFGYPKVHRPTYLIVISTDDHAPNRPHIWIWYVWYLNMNKSTYTHWSKHVGENLPSAMHFIYLLLYLGYFSQRQHACIHLS